MYKHLLNTLTKTTMLTTKLQQIHLKEQVQLHRHFWQVHLQKQTD